MKDRWGDARSFVALLLFCATTGLVAQTTPAVSVPSQFATARTAFLSNAGAPGLGGNEKEGSGWAYESLSRALATDGHYRLTTAPADAELAIEISIEVQISDVEKGSSENAAYLRMAVRDIKTHALLWNIDEPVKGAFRATTFRKNVDEATLKLMADLHSLILGKQP